MTFRILASLPVQPASMSFVRHFRCYYVTETILYKKQNWLFCSQVSKFSFIKKSFRSLSTSTFAFIPESSLFKSYQMSMKSSKSSTIAICQMTCTADLEANFRQCQELIRKGSRKGAEVVFLPEGFDFLMKDKEKILELAEHLDGPRISKMCKLAEENGVWLSLGGFHCKHPSETRRVLNCHVVIDNKGRIAASYNKTHLFDVNIEGGPCLKESAFIAHGDRIVPPVSTPVGKLGLGICYDLRFPEFSMILARQGADILSFPSAFTFHTGSAHWEVLLRSRAIETQCYVVAAAQCGKLYEGREAYGHSMVVDPWGTVVAQCQDGIGLCMAEIDHQYIQKVRSGMPILSHRRVDLYGSLAAKERDME